MPHESNARVAQHIVSTPSLTEQALRSMAMTSSREAAAREMLQKCMETPKTPNGDTYTMISIRRAMCQLDREIFK